MDGSMEISLDKLPVKRLDAIEENGAERFPSDVGYDEKRLSLIRRIDFAWAVEKDENKKKQKKASQETSSTSLPWQSLMENLQLAHQELSVIIDLINTVEANDVVTVAGMTKPKPLPNETLSDLAVSAATKLQCFRHLGKYFKQSAKALEQKIGREARFYGSLIRLQQNWKVKRQRLAASAPGNEGFTIDLYDNSLYDPTVVIRPSMSTVRVDHDSAGMLAVRLPPNSCRSLHFGFFGAHSQFSVEYSSKETKKDSPSDDDECVKETHSILREVHQAIFAEQVFDLVNREAFSPSIGVNVTGIRENYLQLSIGQEASVFILLMASGKDDENDDKADTQKLETAVLPSDDEVKLVEVKKSAFPNRISFEIYLQQIFHEHAFVRGKDKTIPSGRGQSTKEEKFGLLGHFCMSLSHRIFSNKVVTELESLVCRVPYLHLITHPTWHSRTSSWTLSMKVPQSILHMKNSIKSQFRTKVVVTDDSISVEGEGGPNVVGLFKTFSEDMCSMNKYECDLADLPVTLLQQVASQVIRWLHEEALMVGIKASRDFLCLSFEVEQGEMISLVAHVDPKDERGYISWWLVMEDGFAEERKIRADIFEGGSEYRKFLGYLNLDLLYSTLMDLVSMCNGGGNH